MSSRVIFYQEPGIMNTKEVFYKEIADILEVSAVNDTDRLQDFAAWDSLAILSTIAILDSKFGFTIDASSIHGDLTVGELAALVEARRDG